MSQKHASSPFVPSKTTLFTSPQLSKVQKQNQNNLNIFKPPQNVPAISISFKNQFTLNLLGASQNSNQKGSFLTSREPKQDKFPLGNITTSNYVQGHFTTTQRSMDSGKGSDSLQTNKINDILQSAMTQREKSNIDLSISATIGNKSLEKQMQVYKRNQKKNSFRKRAKPKSMDQYNTSQTLNKSIQSSLIQSSQQKQICETNDKLKQKPISQTNIINILNKINSSKQSIGRKGNLVVMWWRGGIEKKVGGKYINFENSLKNYYYLVETVKPTTVNSPAQNLNFKKLLDSYMKKPSSGIQLDSQQKTERGAERLEKYSLEFRWLNILDGFISINPNQYIKNNRMSLGLLLLIKTSHLIIICRYNREICHLLWAKNFNYNHLLQDLYQLILSYLYSKKERGQLSLKSFYFLQCIGIGGFSRVYLVRSKATGHFLALKLISKQFIVENQKQSIVQNERDVMCQLTMSKSALRKKFVCSLECAFETKTWVCFGMEYCSGGELFNQLRKVKRMTEDEARPYFIQVCIAVSFLHDHNVLYRDIKPENILIDADGYIKLADFGLARPNMAPDDEAYSFCGSPEYMAPEMLKQQGHTFAVDFYCLGALLYELITGLPPFYSRDTNKIFQSILTEELQFSKGLVSLEAKDLIKKLLMKNPLQRLGTKEGIEGILKHPWITKIDPNKVLHHQFKPPFDSNLKSFNFDPREFTRGESKFNQEFTKSMNDESENKFSAIFDDFYFIGENLKGRRVQQQSCETERSMTTKEKEKDKDKDKYGSIINAPSQKQFNFIILSRSNKEKYAMNQTKVVDNSNIQKRLQQQNNMKQSKQQMRSLITEPNENNTVNRGFFQNVYQSWLKQKIENINRSQEDIQKDKYLLQQFYKNK